jgi:DNA polymerase I-like protein with 3'-5' exonuclease and polymerase domains
MNFNFNNETYNIKTWNGERLGKFVALDTETEVRPFHMVPDIVTLQAYAGGTDVYYVPVEKIRHFLNAHYDSILILHNAPFDMDVLSKKMESSHLIYDLYDRCRVRDTSVLYRLIHLGIVGFVPFKYNLQLLADKYLGVKIEKDERRENFAQFLGKSINEIPGEYLEYGAIDVIVTYQVYFILMGLLTQHDTHGTLLRHDIQVKGDLALNHIHKNGIGFNLSERDTWLTAQDAEMERYKNVLASWGWVRGVKGVKERYERIIEYLGIALPRTADGSVSSKEEDLEPYKGNPFIDAYLGYQKLEKATSFVRNITSGVVNPRYNLMVNTGRTSCSKPNFQQLPRLGGVREMFVPTSKDNTFIITDYSAIELATLAQVMYKRYGESVMRDRINDGEDLHKFYASVMHECDTKDVTKQWRQEAKAANFGFSGGLGVATFVQFSSGYGLSLTEEQARDMKEAWHHAFPETRDYLSGEQGFVYTLTGRKRGNTTFCAEKNTPFQGLAADGAKLALYELDKAGFRIAGFVHDEIICEVPRDQAETLLKKQEELMIKGMKQVVPDVKIGVESMISEHYTK